MTEAPIVTVKQGQLQGKVVNGPSGKAFYSFQGIPYAKPPLGSLRFRAPQPPESWEGIRDATTEGNVAPQTDPIFAKNYVGDENCLFLNVYTPTIKGPNLPVMFWIHGGGFIFGSGHTDLYGPDYLVEKDVIVVTINYRCSYLGFLCLNTPEVPGNAGVKDIIQALKWVKENIHNFGGDSGNITIFGESAGAVVVSILCASPLTKHLISKAILQSGNALPSAIFQQEPVKNAKDLAKHLGCDSEDVDEILEFLITAPTKDIAEACVKMNALEKYREEINVCGMVVEKEFPGVEAVLTENFIDFLTSGRIANVPIMTGITSEEMAFKPTSDDLQSFIPKVLNIEKDSAESLAIAEKIKNLYFKSKPPTDPESLLEFFNLVSDRFFNMNTQRFIKILVQVINSPIYFYKFDYIGELNISNHNDMFSLGYKSRVAHMDELGYLFKNDFQKNVEPTSQDIKMRERMVRLWTNFAKFGNPTPDTDQHLPIPWLPVTKDELYYLNLGSELTLSSNPDKEKMDFWDDLYNRYFRIWEYPRTNTDEPPRKNVHKALQSSHEERRSVEHHGKHAQRFVKSEPTKTVHNSNGIPKDVIRANDPPEDDLPKNISVNKFVNYYESLGDKK